MAELGTLLMAQSTPNSRVLLWVGVLLGVALVGGFFMILLRKRLFSKEAPLEASGSLMESVRQMHKAGQISTEEFDRVRKKLARQVKDRSERGPSAGADQTSGAGEKQFGSGAVARSEELPPERTRRGDGPKRS